MAKNAALAKRPAWIFRWVSVTFSYFFLVCMASHHTDKLVLAHLHTPKTLIIWLAIILIFGTHAKPSVLKN